MDTRVAADYINDAILDAPDLLPKVLRNVAEARRMSSVADAAGVNRESLYRALSQQGNPTWETLHSVLTAVGLRLQVSPQVSINTAHFEPSPILESAPGTTAIAHAKTRNSTSFTATIFDQFDVCTLTHWSSAAVPETPGTPLATMEQLPYLNRTSEAQNSCSQRIH